MKIVETKSLLYYDTGKSSFVIKDLTILKSKFTVIDYSFQASKLSLAYQLVKQFFHTIYHLPKCDAVIVQFAGYHSLIPFIFASWFGKKKIIIAGGTDCVSFPSIGYGTFQKLFLKWFTKKTFELASLILPVDETLIDYSYTYSNDDFPRQGYRNFVKNISGKEIVIHNGYDPDFWSPRPVERKQYSFVTVGFNLATKFAQKLKGIDLYIELAKRFPEFDFSIIGGKKLKISGLPKNIHLLPNVANEELPDIYSSFSYYVQLSISEGFPNALSEAILCGCIPIVSNVGAMPMIVNDDRLVLMKRNIDEVELLVKKIIKKENYINHRKYVATHFTFEKRKEKLLKEINEIV